MELNKLFEEDNFIDIAVVQVIGNIATCNAVECTSITITGPAHRVV